MQGDEFPQPEPEMAEAENLVVVLFPASITQRLPAESKASPTGFLNPVILEQPLEMQELTISTTD